MPVRHSAPEERIGSIRKARASLYAEGVHGVYTAPLHYDIPQSTFLLVAGLPGLVLPRSNRVWPAAQWVICGFKPANVMSGAPDPLQRSILFSFELTLPGG